MADEPNPIPFPCTEESSQMTTAQSYEYENELYGVFQEERKMLIEHEHSHDHAVNTALITISSGALAISLVILKDFRVPDDSPFNLLGLGWLMLVLSLLLALLTAKLNQETHSRFRDILDQEFVNGTDGALERARARQRRSMIRASLIFVEWSSFVLCIAGTILVFVFFYCGIQLKQDEYVEPPSSATAARAEPATTTKSDETD